MKTITPEKPRGRGRPPLPAGEARTVFAAFKVSSKEDEIIRKASKKARMPMAEWMRRMLLESAERQAA